MVSRRCTKCNHYGMNVLESIRDIGHVVVNLPTVLRERRIAIETASELRSRADYLEESLSELEAVLDETGWREQTAMTSSWNFRRSSLRKMMDLARRIYLINPLMRRSVNVQALYVWALGVTIKSKDKAVQAVLDAFFEDPKNQVVLTSNPAWQARERDQQILGNTFLALFYNEDTGACRVRTIPVDQMVEVVKNPDDAQEVWYYKRQYADLKGVEQTLYYADINFHSEDTPATYEEKMVEQNVCVLHIKTGGFPDMDFGLPEHYSIFGWCVAYKQMLENWATIIQAYARMAMKITGLKGKSGIAAAKSKMGTNISASSRVIDNNPPNNTGGWFAASGGADISAIRTAGATTSASEGKPLKDMVAAGADIPSHFYGDSDQGNFATSTTLDRPTELKFVSRQKLWMSVILQITDKLVLWSAQAPSGTLKTAGASVEEITNDFDSAVTYRVLMGGAAPFVEVMFPEILERNVTERVRAVVAAATLGGSKAEGIIPNRKYLAGLILQALSVQDWQEKLEALYPADVVQGFIDPTDELEVSQIKAQGTADLGKAALNQADTAATVAAKPTPTPAGPTSNAR